MLLIGMCSDPKIKKKCYTMSVKSNKTKDLFFYYCILLNNNKETKNLTKQQKKTLS